MHSKSSAVRPSNTCRLALALIVISSLTGCAGARISNVQSTTAAVGVAPAEVLVEVDIASDIGAAQQKDASKVRSGLESGLVQHLVKNGFAAEPFVAGISHPGAAVLHVSITEADSGSLAKRMIIGWGWGKATLQAKADLERADDSLGQSVTAFDTTSDSGIKPGLLLPVGVALATGNTIGLAVGGTINIATNVRGGLSKPIKNTSVAMVDQLKKYYQSAGWAWPDAKKKA